MKKFEIEIEKVNGPCSYSYEQGDKFVFNGYDIIFKVRLME